MRGPHCEGLDTKRNSKTAAAPVGANGRLKPLRRFLGRAWGRSSTSMRTTARRGASFSDEVMVEAVRLYV
jgi:hypothetical protein